MSDTAIVESTVVDYLDKSGSREEVGDLSTGIDMLIKRLDDILKNIISEEDAFASWQDAQWIALRLREDVKRIDRKMLAESNAEYEARGPASREQLQ